MKDRITEKGRNWLAEAKERDWKKVARNGLVVFGLLAGNALAGTYLYNVEQKMREQDAKLNFLRNRLAVTEQFQAEDSFYLCLSFLQNRPTSLEEDETECEQLVLGRESLRPK